MATRRPPGGQRCGAVLPGRAAAEDDDVVVGGHRRAAARAAVASWYASSGLRPA